MINTVKILILIFFTIVENTAFAQKNNTKLITPVNNNLNQAQDIVNGDKNVTNNITIKENYGTININEKEVPSFYIVNYKEFTDSFFNIQFGLIDPNHLQLNNVDIQMTFRDTVEYVELDIKNVATCTGTKWLGSSRRTKHFRYIAESCSGKDFYIEFTIKSKQKTTVSLQSNYPIRQ